MQGVHRLTQSLRICLKDVSSIPFLIPYRHTGLGMRVSSGILCFGISNLMMQSMHIRIAGGGIPSRSSPYLPFPLANSFRLRSRPNLCSSLRILHILPHSLLPYIDLVSPSLSSTNPLPMGGTRYCSPLMLLRSLHHCPILNCHLAAPPQVLALFLVGVANVVEGQESLTLQRLGQYISLLKF